MAGTQRMVFPMAVCDRLTSIADGTKVTLHCIQLTSMESVQVRGSFHSAENGAGYIEIAQVYNPMLYRPGIIYPRAPYATITHF